MEIYARDELNVARKSDDSPVTEADLAADHVIAEGLARAFPDIPAITEESATSHHETGHERFFLVDPLDGTKDFVRRGGDFTVNIALIERGRPRVGIVYAPARGRLWMTKGSGAIEVSVEARAGREAEATSELMPDLQPEMTRGVGAGSEASAAEQAASANRDAVQNAAEGGKGEPPKLLTGPQHHVLVPGSERPIHVRKPDNSALAIVASKSHRDRATDEFIARYHVAEFCAAGSSLKFCLLAAGEADFYPRLGRTMEWDTAAGHAILGAAGGTVLRMEDRRELGYGKPGWENPFFLAIVPGVEL